MDGAVQGQGGADGGDEGCGLEFGLGARDGEVEGRDIRVWIGGGCGRGSREELRGGVELGVDLDADSELPVWEPFGGGIRSARGGVARRDFAALDLIFDLFAEGHVWLLGGAVEGGRLNSWAMPRRAGVEGAEEGCRG